MDKDAIMEARNELSDVINTWKGLGIHSLDPALHDELDRILGLLDAELFKK